MERRRKEIDMAARSATTAVVRTLKLLALDI